MSVQHEQDDPAWAGARLEMGNTLLLLYDRSGRNHERDQDRAAGIQAF